MTLIVMCRLSSYHQTELNFITVINSSYIFSKNTFVQTFIYLLKTCSTIIIILLSIILHRTVTTVCCWQVHIDRIYECIFHNKRNVI